MNTITGSGTNTLQTSDDERGSSVDTILLSNTKTIVSKIKKCISGIVNKQ